MKVFEVHVGGLGAEKKANNFREAVRPRPFADSAGLGKRERFLKAICFFFGQSGADVAEAQRHKAARRSS